MADRNIRYAEEIKKEIAGLIQRDLKDPRIPQFTSIVHVDVDRDLTLCRIYVSTLDENLLAKAVEGLKSATGYIKRELGRRLRMRAMPELVFFPDKSIEQGIRITKLIDDTVSGARGNGPERNSGGNKA